MPIFGLVNFAGLFSFFLLTFVCRTPLASPFKERWHDRRS
nr:MAG TPA: hypothetical protein [Caudoviricetes sp.]